MNADSVQPALRNFIETFTIIVDLYLLVITRIKLFPAALHSRCTVIDFTIKNGQKVKNRQVFYGENVFSP